MNNLDKLDTQIYLIFKREYGREPSAIDGIVSSQIKQSILKAIMEGKPKESHINYHIEDGIEYRDQNDAPISISWEKGYNRALEQFESVIKEILK
jgi:hypothetical protein